MTDSLSLAFALDQIANVLEIRNGAIDDIGEIRILTDEEPEAFHLTFRFPQYATVKARFGFENDHFTFASRIELQTSTKHRHIELAFDLDVLKSELEPEVYREACDAGYLLLCLQEYASYLLGTDREAFAEGYQVFASRFKNAA